MASAIGGVEDLIVEDGEVECEPKADGVGRCELGLGDIGSTLVFMSVAIISCGT
jgi:hypothetical protein